MNRDRTLSAEVNCRDLDQGNTKVFRGSAGRVIFLRHDDDPAGVNRILASVPGLTVEVLPSKGFSVGQAWQEEVPVFWEPPTGLCDPEELDLYSQEVAIKGMPAPGFTFLKTFSGGIELYGLRNWGMPFQDPETGSLHPLHGETSSIPVETCEVFIGSNELILTGTFLYRDIPLHPVAGDLKENRTGPWYDRGEGLFRVERQVVLERDRPCLRLHDTITNISKRAIMPSWGYHITFHPGAESSILVPSSSVKNRSGEPVPEDFERWSPAPDPGRREERGMIHRGLKVFAGEATGMSRAVVVRQDAPDIRITFPVTPYFQTWICRGGAFSGEFTRASDGKPLFLKPWDGIGIEIGSDALDHNGNTDPAVAGEEQLAPGASRIIHLSLDFPSGQELEQEIRIIKNYNTERFILTY